MIGQVKGWQWLKSWRLDELVPNPGHEAVARRRSSKGSVLDPVARSLQQHQQPRLWSYTSRASSSCVLLRTRKACRSWPGCQRKRWLRSMAAVGTCSWATSTPPSELRVAPADSASIVGKGTACDEEWMSGSISPPCLVRRRPCGCPAQPPHFRHGVPAG